MRKSLQEGVFFNYISDNRFKTNRLSIFLVTELCEKNAAAYALLPNLLRKGTAEHPDFTEFNQFLNEQYGAYVDCGVQKRGDAQLIYLSIVGIDDKFTLEGEKLTQELASILCAMLFTPVCPNESFLEKEIALEKETLMDTIRAEINEKRTYALNQANRLLCAGEPAGLSKFGTLDQVKALTKETVMAAYHHLLETACIELFFTGSGNASVFEACCQTSLKKLNRKVSLLQLVKPHVRRTEILDEVEHVDVAQSKMVLGFATGVLETPQEMASMQLMVSILGGTPLSKLFVNVREKLSLCYYCAARLDGVKGLLKIDSGVESQNIIKAKEEILCQLDEMKQGNFTDEEISNALMSLENSYRTTNDSVAGLESYYLGQVLHPPVFTPEEKAKLLGKVTREEVVMAANKVQLELCYLLTGKEG